MRRGCLGRGGRDERGRFETRVYNPDRSPVVRESPPRIHGELPPSIIPSLVARPFHVRPVLPLHPPRQDCLIFEPLEAVETDLTTTMTYDSEVPHAQGVPYFTPRQDPPVGTPLPGQENLPTVFTPLKIRGVTLPHRITVSPMCTYSESLPTTSRPSNPSNPRELTSVQALMTAS